MKNRTLVLMVTLVLLAPLTASASEHRHFVMVRPYFGGWYQPWAGIWAGPWAGPWPGPYWDPYGGPLVTPFPRTGEVKLDTKVKDAQVFVNGGYVGTTKDNGTLHLAPGGYKIEIREGDRTAFSEDVYVQAGKTMHLHPKL
jgi:hypothetical protein